MLKDNTKKLQVDAKHKELRKITLAGCNYDFRKYNDKHEAIQNELSNMGMPLSDEWRESFWRLGLPSLIRKDAATWEPSLGVSRQSAHGKVEQSLHLAQKVIAVLLRSHSPDLSPDSPPDPTITSTPVSQDHLASTESAPPARLRTKSHSRDTDRGLPPSSRPADTKRRADGDAETDRLPLQTKRVRFVPPEADCAMSDGNAPSDTRSLPPRLSTRLEAEEVTSDDTLLRADPDPKFGRFAVGAKATTSLIMRISETNSAIIHLLNERDYDSAIIEDIIFYSSICLGQLDPTLCPRFPLQPYNDFGPRGCEITVTSENAIDAATALIRETVLPSGELTRKDRVLVLNMFHTGEEIGGKYGVGAQGSQEELCYRTSFSFTFLVDDVEVEDDGIGYSAKVVIMRESSANGHAWYDLSRPERLGVISVASLSANPKPALVHTSRTNFANASDHEDMKKRWRSVLRLAVAHRHIRLVLGMPGCEHQTDAPVAEIADCFKEVLQEQEFKGGWFTRIVFAVPNQKGVHDTAKRMLHGSICG